MYSSGPVALEYDYQANGIKMMWKFKSDQRELTINKKK